MSPDKRTTRLITYALLLALPLSVMAMSDLIHIDRISDYLTKNTPSKDPVINFDVAANWLEEKEKRSLLQRLRGTESTMIEPLRDFVELKNINKEDVRCSEKSYHVLEKNNRNFEGTVSKATDINTCKRAQAVVYQVAVEHAQVCLPTYESRFRDAVAKLPKDVTVAVDSIMDKIVSRHLGEESSRQDPRRLDLSVLSMHKNPFIGTSRIKVFVDYLRQAGLGKEIDDTLATTSEYNQKLELAVILNERLLNPCMHYMDAVNQIFLSRELDLRVLSAKEEWLSFDMEYGNVKVRVCRSMQNNFDEFVEHFHEFLLISRQN